MTTDAGEGRRDLKIPRGQPRESSTLSSGMSIPCHADLLRGTTSATMRPSPWSTHLVGAVLLCGAVLACGSRRRDDAFLASRVPVDRLDSVLGAADSVHLRLARARTLLRVVAESDFAAKLPHDTMSIAEIVAWGRAQHVQRGSVAAAAAAAPRGAEGARRRELDSPPARTGGRERHLPKEPGKERVH